MCRAGLSRRRRERDSRENDIRRLKAAGFLRDSEGQKGSPVVLTRKAREFLARGKKGGNHG